MKRSSPSSFRSWHDALAHPLFREPREKRVAPVLWETAPWLVPAGKILNNARPARPGDEGPSVGRGRR